MKTRSKTITTFFAVALFVSAAFPAWAGGGKDSGKDKKQNNVVASYSVYNTMNKVITGKPISLGLIFEAGKYYLKVSRANETYTKYLIGCKSNDGGWYLWSNGAWTKTTDEKYVNAFTTILANTTKSDGVETILDTQANTATIRSSGFEIALQNLSLRFGTAAVYASLSKDLIDDGDANRVRIPAYLPDGSLFVADSTGLSREIVVGLFPQNGYGDGLVFKRNAGMFVGESALFNTAPYGTVSYDQKALALLYEFFNDKGLGDTFKSTMESFHLSYAVNWTRFSGVDAETKKSALKNMANVLGNGFRETYREIVNGRSVFGSAKKQNIFRSLYGDRRNIYFDAYLAFCYSTGRPVYASLVRDENPGQSYDPTQYETIKENDSVHEGKELAAAAMRFYTWGVEYTLMDASGKEQVYAGKDHFGSLFTFLKSTKTWSSDWLVVNNVRTANYWKNDRVALNETGLPIRKNGDDRHVIVPFSSVKASGYDVPFADGAGGYPLPYAQDGIDSPRTFAYKMSEQMRVRYAKNQEVDMRTTRSTSNPPYEKDIRAGYFPFIPGDFKGTLKQAGIDALGLLSGSIAMTSYYNTVPDLGNTSPGSTLDGYYAMISKGAGRDENGKPLYGTGLPGSDWKTLRFESEDLEKCSVVVPDLSLLQLGDIIVEFGDDKTSSSTKIGIVVGINGPRPQYHTNQVDFMQNVTVVTVSSAYKQVTLGTWGYPTNMFGGFTEKPERCHVRRLLKRKAPGNDGVYPIAKWDVFDNTPQKLEAAVNGMREQTRIGATSTTKERWVPNTGEYLLFTDLRLSAMNAAGVDLDLEKTTRGDYEVYVKGAVDRGYNGVAGQGNIYNNTPNSGFELVLISKNGSDIKKLGLLTNEGTVAGTYTLKTTASSSDLYDSNGKNKQSDNAARFAKSRIWIGTNSCVSGWINGDEDYRLGIRPAAEKSARPGDDLCLELAIRKRATTTPVTFSYIDSDGKKQSKSAIAMMAEKDYVAVYDKKLLWRANLYIDQPEETTDANGNKIKGPDWNDQHPWITGNEWNRYYNGTQSANKLTDLSEVTVENKANPEKGIPAGIIPGGQVVKFPDWTPLRTVGGTTANPSATNKISGTVAYSFPSHPGAHEQGGLAGSMDSPFDFIWKMKKQQEALWWTYKEDGTKPKLNPATTKGWSNFVAPTRQSSQWKTYLPADNTVTQMFIPSLGLFYGYNSNNEAGIISKTNLDYWKWDKTFEAGTDCLGLVQRSMGWNNPDGTPNFYQWRNLPAGIMESGTTTYTSVLDAHTGNHQRQFPIYSTDVSIAVIDRDSATYNSANQTWTLTNNPQPSIDDLRKVIPGDIWVKDNSDAGTEKDNHIAIVAHIPEYHDGMTAETYMTGMILIEGEFTSKVQSVIKNLSVGDYNNNNLTSPRTFYLGVSFPRNGLELNCASWAIRRLK